MLYLFYTDKRFLIDKEIEKITKGLDPFSVSRYDLENTDINVVIDDALTMPFLDDKKVVIADNAFMFTAAAFDNKTLEEYLNNCNPSTTLIFIVNSDKIDSRKKITKLIKDKGQIKDFKEELDPRSFIQKNLKDYKISPRTIELLIDRVGDNLLILEKEIEKIKLYKGEELDIKDADIINLTVKTSFEDIFKLIDYIVTNNKAGALEIYNYMIKMGEEPIKIIIILAGQIRLMYQAKRLLKKGLSEKNIADTLKIHPYRVKLALQNGRSYTEEVLLGYLSDLADIDYGIKSGSVSKDLALELFILKK